MYLKTIFILVLSVQFVSAKKSDIGNHSLGINLHDNKFGFDMTPAERLHKREAVVEAFIHNHSPNFEAETLTGIKSNGYCQETLHYQNVSSSAIDYYTWRMRGQVSETKLTARNSWGGSMTAESSGKDYTFDNAIY